jgi:cyclopropane fatty-acyl-phospholipid synthase-like methyltransferase
MWAPGLETTFVREHMSDLKHGEVLRKVGDYYTARLAAHGATHRGADWNSEESQDLRFEQLLKVVDPSGKFSINDYGCGYGALALFLAASGRSFEYHGFDISQAMIATARSVTMSVEGCTFCDDLSLVRPADYTVASGIFSVKLDIDEAKWKEYVIDTIAVIAAKSTKGFAFNMLTRYSDADRMRRDLYYADPHFFFDHCRERYSRYVALLHDYPLFEFTILVRYL